MNIKNSLNTKSEQAYDSYLHQKRTLQNMGGGNGEVASVLQTKLEEMMEWIGTPVESNLSSQLLNEFIEGLKTQLDVGITKSLKVISREKDLKKMTIEEIKEEWKQSKYWEEAFKSSATNKDTVSESSVKQMIDTIKQLKAKYSNDKEYEAPLQILTGISTKLSYLLKKAQGKWLQIAVSQNMEGVNSNIRRFGRFKGAEKDSVFFQINKLLNLAQSLMAKLSVSQITGIVGEQVIAAMLAMLINGEERGLETILKPFSSGGEGIQSLKAGGLIFKDGSSVQIVGEEKSEKGFISKESSFQGMTSTPFGDKFFHSFSATDDKVDIKVEITPGRETIVPAGKFSIKNYGSWDLVRLLSGNLYPILAMYDDFLKRYKELATTIPKNTNDHQNCYKAIKITVGVHGLIGGVLAKKNEKIGYTEAVDYFVAINNLTGKIVVLDTKSMVNQIIEDGEKLIAILDGQTDLTSTQFFQRSPTTSGLSGLVVDLRLNHLLGESSSLDK